MRWQQQTDAHTYRDNVAGGGIFVALYNGDGPSVARKAERYMYARFAAHQQHTPVFTAFTKSYAETAKFLEKEGAHTTATTALIRGKEIHFANVGDSHMLVCGKTSFRRLTTARWIKSGAVMRPAVGKYELDPDNDRWLILSTKALFNTLDDRVIAHLCRNQTENEIVVERIFKQIRRKNPSLEREISIIILQLSSYLSL